MRDCAGKMAWVNDAALAEKWLAQWAPAQSTVEGTGLDDATVQRGKVIEAGLHVAHMTTGAATTPLASAIKALRLLNAAVNAAKHREADDLLDRVAHSEEGEKPQGRQLRRNPSEPEKEPSGAPRDAAGQAGRADTGETLAAGSLSNYGFKMVHGPVPWPTPDLCTMGACKQSREKLPEAGEGDGHTERRAGRRRGRRGGHRPKHGDNGVSGIDRGSVDACRDGASGEGSELVGKENDDDAGNNESDGNDDDVAEGRPESTEEEDTVEEQEGLRHLRSWCPLLSAVRAGTAKENPAAAVMDQAAVSAKPVQSCASNFEAAVMDQAAVSAINLCPHGHALRLTKCHANRKCQECRCKLKKGACAVVCTKDGCYLTCTGCTRENCGDDAITRLAEAERAELLAQLDQLKQREKCRAGIAPPSMVRAADGTSQFVIVPG